MFYSLLVIAVIGALIYWLKRWQTVPEEKRLQFGKQSILWGTAIVIIALVVSGRAHWLMGIMAALLALAGRAVQLAQYVPIFKKIFGDAQAQTQNSSNGQNSSQAPVGQPMTRQQAAELLGIEAGASAEDIRQAHKRLMQKIHPDRGGSDALAKQINQAKDILLK